MTKYSSICWRCRGYNDSGIGTNCLNCREEGDKVLALAMLVFLLISAIIGGSAYICSVLF